jgi:histidine triad (HIT) family protein
MDDCVFCKIIRGEIPCHKILENDKFLAFLDIEPFTEGHTLVIPKIHYRWIYDLPNFGEYWEFTKQVTQILQKNLNPVYISYITMGKLVPHAHIHIIPRYPKDNLVGIYNNRRLKLSNEDLKIIADKIKK